MTYGRCHGLALRLFRNRYLTCAHLYTLLREYQRSADIKRNKKGKQMLFENLNLNAYYHNILLLLLKQVYQNKQR